MQFNFKRIAWRALVALMLSLLFCSGALAASVSAVVNCSSLTVRSGPSTSHKKLGTLKKGTKITVTAVSGSWAKISYKGRTGYAAVQYLKKSSGSSSSSSSSDKKETSSETKYSSRIKGYSTQKVAVYKSASTSSKKLGTIDKGTTVYVVAKNGNFYKVQNASGSVTGYIHKNYLSKTKPAASSSSSSSSSSSASSSSSSASTSGQTKSQKLVSVAKSLVGKPYVLNAKGPSSFDCSGFTNYCYRQIGVSVSGSAQTQGYNRGTKISSKSDLKVGDIVCFDTNAGDGDLSDHVGIYLGGGSFIHASSSAGKVIISNMSSGYYAQTFSWGRRVM